MSTPCRHNPGENALRFLAAFVFASSVFAGALPDGDVSPANVLPPRESVRVVVGPLGHDGDPDTQTLPAILRPRS